MNKEQIISDFNVKEKKLKEGLKETDGWKYLQILPPDPYCFPIDMPRDKFPEYYKCQEEIESLNQEYHRIISQLSKYKKGDNVIIGCEDSIEFGEISNHDFFINGGEDIEYYIKFKKDFNVWKYGSSGGYFGTKSCTCAFKEKDVLMKVSLKEIKAMKKLSAKELKKQRPELFPVRQYDKKLDYI